MLPSFLLAGILAAQAAGVGSGGVGATTTTPPPTVIEQPTTTVVSTTAPPPTPVPTTPPTAPPATDPPVEPRPPSTPAPNRPPATRPATPAVSRTTLPFTPSLEVAEPSEDEVVDQPPEVPAEPTVPASPLVPPVLRMDRPSSEPGGSVVLTGEGCVPDAPVRVGVADVAVGAIAGRDDGGFVAILTLPDFGPGRYDITVDCGTAFTMPIDVVVATSVETPNSVLALFIFFVLLALVLFRRRRIPKRVFSARSTDSEGGPATPLL